MPARPAKLTPLGILIDRKGMAIARVIERSGIDRGRLVYLRTMPGVVPTLTEAEALAPVLEMSLEQFAAKLREIAAEMTKESSDR